VGVAGDVPGTGTVFASDELDGKVRVMQFVERPEAVTGGASDQTGTSARVGGSVNPLGIAVNSCVFEYGTAGLEHSQPCEEPDAVEVGAGTVPVAVHAELSGLEEDKLYRYRLRAGNALFGTEAGLEATFGPPQVEGQSVSDVTAGCARLGAQIDPESSATTYRFEYGASEAYGLSTSPRPAGGGPTTVGVSEVLCGLAAGTTYHFRVLASNASGETEGGKDVAFTTLSLAPGGLLGLPDGRVYELVSPPGSPDAEVYVPEVNGSQAFTRAFGSQAPFHATAGGDGVVFAGSPSGTEASGNEGTTGEGGNVYLARRCVGSERCPWNGWEAMDVQPPGSVTADYEAFTGGLLTGFLNAEDPSPLSPLAPGGGYDVLYSHEPGSESYVPLFTSMPGHRSNGEFGTVGFEYLNREPVAFAGSAETAGGGEDPTGGGLFEANDALLPGGGKLEKELEGDVEREVAEKVDGNYLYDSVGGRLSLVDVMPSGRVAQDAWFGAPNSTGNQEDPPDFDHVISMDGSRVFWSDSTGEIFLRENPTQPQSPLGAKDACTVPADACTIPVSAGPARYWTATRDGSYAFYVEAGELYRFDAVSGKSEALASTGLKGEGAAVAGVIGASENGEKVYFIADGELAAGAVKGAPNLYLYDGAGVTLVATLEANDLSNTWFSGAENGRGTGDFFGDLQPAPGKRTAEVTPDGGAVVFMSQARLNTVNFPEGYDNEGCKSGGIGAVKAVGCAEVYVYEAGSGEGGGLFCVSCAPGGAPPAVHDPNAPVLASFVPVSWSSTYMMRWVSAGGGRVFFDSYEPLVGRDSNGTLDVYEWERDGEGSCGESTGCVYLLSGGVGAQDNASYLVDASESGGDVFIASRSQLLAQNESELVENENMKLYDARVGGIAVLAPSECGRAGCPRTPSTPPVFAAPASETLPGGAGNFPPPAAPPPPKPSTRAEKLAAALKACRKDRSRHKRVVCEAHARKAYGAGAKKAERPRTAKGGRAR
jgi:hypothetical protein